MSDLQRAWLGALGMIIPISLAGYFGIVPVWIAWMTVIVFGGGVIAATIVQKSPKSRASRKGGSVRGGAGTSDGERAIQNAPAHKPTSAAVEKTLGESASESERDFVRESLQQFRSAGLVPTDYLLESIDRYADDSVAGLSYLRSAGTDPNQNRFAACPFPRLTVLWTQVEEDPDPYRYFRNAIVIPDHCYDGCFGADGEAAYQELIESILSIAADQWSAEVESVQCFEDPDKNERIRIKLDSTPSEFRITNQKNLDLNLFALLNQHVPSDIHHRFGVLADGGSVLVLWLEPKQWARLSEVLGTAMSPADWSPDDGPNDQT